MSTKISVQITLFFTSDWWNLQFRYFYPWVTYLFTGMTSEEVQALTEKAIYHPSLLRKILVFETWESPESLKGEAGQVKSNLNVGVIVKKCKIFIKALQDKWY